MKKYVFYLALFSIAIMISCNKKNNIPNPTSYNLNVTADIVEFKK
jgi:hypothetical protein